VNEHPPESPAPPSATAAPAVNAPRGHSAWRSRSAWVVLLGVAIFSIVADLGSKWLAFRMIADNPVVLDAAQVRADVMENATHIGRQHIPPHEPVTVIPGVLDLTLVLNPGAVFGVAPGGRWFFVLFTAGAFAFGLWIFGTWTHARDRWAHAALGLVVGGGLGNVYDRLLYGCVRDFIHPLPGVKFPFGLKLMDRDGHVWPYVSNVADLLLLIGIGMLLVFLWRRDAKPHTAAAASSTASHGAREGGPGSAPASSQG
jgi:signal peptidase II